MFFPSGSPSSKWHLPITQNMYTGQGAKQPLKNRDPVVFDKEQSSITQNKKHQLLQCLSPCSSTDTAQATSHLFNVFEVFCTVKGTASCYISGIIVYTHHQIQKS